MNDERERIRREIARNAALVARRDPKEIALRIDPDAQHGFVAVASASGTEQTFRAYGATEDEATWSLLMLVVDAANGSPIAQSLVMTPQVREALRLLQLSRTEILDEIRRELDANSASADLDGAPKGDEPND